MDQSEFQGGQNLKPISEKLQIDSEKGMQNENTLEENKQLYRKEDTITMISETIRNDIRRKAENLKVLSHFKQNSPPVLAVQ